MVRSVTSPTLEPAAKQFAEATANPPFLFDLGPTEGRTTVDKVQSGDVVKPPADLEDLTIAGGPSGSVSIRIVRPKGATRTLPVVLYIHGAGWVFGNSHTHDRLIREIATGTGAAVVFPNYSLSPEAPYPVAIEESYAVAQWVAASGSDHSLDGARMAIPFPFGARAVFRAAPEPLLLYADPGRWR